MADLKVGTYRLTQDVKTLSPDRRYKHLWTAQPVVPAGTLFSVTDYYDKSVADLEMGPKSARRYRAIPSCHPLFQLIAPFLEPIEEQPSDLLARRGWDNMGTEVLDQLAKDGLITVAQVESALARVLES